MQPWFQLVSAYPWTKYVLEIAGLIAGAWLLRHLVIRYLRRLATSTQSTLDDSLLDILDRAIKPILVLSVLMASMNLFDLPPRVLRVFNRGLSLAVLVALLYYTAKTVQLLVNSWLSRTADRTSLRDPVNFLVRVLFAGLAAMIVLDNLGISLTAVWTTLGVGSVAVALALQDTLTNFFAGVYLRIDNPVRAGDYIKLESGEEGFVLHLGWRSTRIRTLPNNVVVVPNAKLASAIVTNFSLPEPRMSLLISVSVSYDCDPERVERILVEETKRAAGKVEGLLADPAPFVRFIPGFGDSSLDFTLICQVCTFVDQYLVQHELRKRIFARFRREGITIPFPQREVHIRSQEAASLRAVGE